MAGVRGVWAAVGQSQPDAEEPRRRRGRSGSEIMARNCIAAGVTETCRPMINNPG